MIRRIDAAPPALRTGDHLTRAEFHRRYEALPPHQKAELIEGVVYMGAAVRHVEHGQPHAAVMGWLTAYWAMTAGVLVGDNSTLKLDDDNEPQPDAVLLIDPARGGQAQFEGGYVVGAPELVVEVSASTVSMDMNTKREVYRRCGVLEYVVWRVEEGAVDWFVRRRGRFARLAAGADGLHRSGAFPGLWLDAAALTAFRIDRLVAAVGRGAATAEHAAFVERLAGGAAT